DHAPLAGPLLDHVHGGAGVGGVRDGDAVVGGGGVAPATARGKAVPAGAEAGLHPLGGEVERGAGVEPEVLAGGAVVNRRLADELQPAGAVGLEEAHHAAG